MTQIWFRAAAVLVLAELLVTTFFMLPFAIGAFFAGIASLITEKNKSNDVIIFDDFGKIKMLKFLRQIYIFY